MGVSIFIGGHDDLADRRISRQAIEVSGDLPLRGRRTGARELDDRRIAVTGARVPEGTGSPMVPTEFWKPTKILPLRPVMSSGWVTDAFPLGVLILIGVPAANAVVLNPEALPVVELAVLLVLDELAALLVLDELAVLLDLLLEPQPVTTAAAITAAATRLAVDTRECCGSFKLEDVMVGSPLSELRGE